MTKKQTFITFMLLLTAISGWAQESKNEKKDSIPPIIVEGTLERVPEGTEIWIFERLGKSLTSGEIKEAKDSLRNGKFRIVFTPKNKNDEYTVMGKYGASLSRHSLFFYASPGTTTTITGVGVYEDNWYVKNDNPIQKEANEYRAYLDEKIPGYWDLKRRNDWVTEEDEDYYSVKRKVKEADSLYVECMTEFMQNREFSPVFEKYIFQISRYILFSRNKVQREKAAKLLVKAPKVENRWDNEFIYEARRDLMPKFEPLRIGEKLHDFVLYDHQDKEHHLTEFNGNGKFLLLEFNSRTCKGCMEHRQYDALNSLYKNHSDKVDMLMVNCDALYYWDIECKDPNKYGRDPWHEWNDKKNAEGIMQRYGSESGPCYFFVSPDGTILGRISDQEDLKAAIAKYFKL
ncbi:MAG: redoxin domain-containing protein [Prevotella sp.]|nr:redoxin domain-containing protein [Prevotella sp.]